MTKQTDGDITPKLTLSWTYSNPGRRSLEGEPIVLKCPAMTNDMRYFGGIFLTIGEALTHLEEALNDDSGKDGLSWRDFTWTPEIARAEIALYEKLVAMGCTNPGHHHDIARHRVIREGITFERAAKEALKRVAEELARTPEEAKAAEEAAGERLRQRGIDLDNGMPNAEFEAMMRGKLAATG